MGDDERARQPRAGTLTIPTPPRVSTQDMTTADSPLGAALRAHSISDGIPEPVAQLGDHTVDVPKTVDPDSAEWMHHQGAKWVVHAKQVEFIGEELAELDDRCTTNAKAITVLHGQDFLPFADFRTEIRARLAAIEVGMWGAAGPQPNTPAIIEEARAARVMAKRWTRAAMGAIGAAVAIAIKISGIYANVEARIVAIEHRILERGPFIDAKFRDVDATFGRVWTAITGASEPPAAPSDRLSGPDRAKGSNSP